MFDNINLFTLLLVAVGIYMVVCAIRGKGKLFENEHTKCSPEDYLKWMRLASFISGLVVIIHGALLVFGVIEDGSTADTVLTWVVLALIIGVVVLNVVLTDRKAMEAERKKQEEEQRNSASKNHPLHAAFFFDDEEGVGASDVEASDVEASDYDEDAAANSDNEA